MKRYEYQIPKKVGFICLFVFGLFAYLSFAKAMKGGTLSYKSIEFSPEFTLYFAWGSFLMFTAMAILGVLVIIKSFGEPRTVRVYDDKIVAPKTPISSQINTIFYRNITELTLNQVGKHRQLIIRDSKQKIVLGELNFQDKADFAEIVDTVQKNR